MNNEDMTRFYEVGTDLGRPGDFVRRDKDGKVPGGLTLNKYTVSDATNSAQLQALAEFISDNIGRIIAVYGVFSGGGRQSLSYMVDTTGAKPYLALTSTAMLIGGSKEIQIRQIEQGIALYDRWISLTGQSDNNVSYVNNGKSNFASIEVYYL